MAATGRDWLGRDNEIQFFFHSSRSEPLHVVGVADTSRYTIQVEVKSLRGNELSNVLDKLQAYSLDSATGRCQGLDTSRGHAASLTQLWKLRLPDYKYCSYSFIVCDPGKQCIGRAGVLPEQLSDLEGTLVLTLLNADLSPVGTISLEYVVILPCDALDDYSLDDTWRQRFWTDLRQPMLFGHRGNGMTYKTDPRPEITENTIESFEKAMEKGAVGVEFDVVLTKDLVPVIYHDLNISISVASGRYYDVLLKDLTHDELQNFKIATKYKSKHQLTSGSPATENVRTKVFPTLKEVLDSVPESLIFNVEVKYPLPKENGEDCDCFPYTNRNVIADVVISTLYQFGAKRNMVISCFNPSLCTMLHLKQPLIPVLFLTEATTPAYSLAIDIRNQTIFDAVAFAKAQDFVGVSVCADMVNGRPEVVKLVQNNNLLLATWGKENVNDECVSWQKQHAKGIIIISDKLT